MLGAELSDRFALLLFFICRVFLNIFDDIDDSDVFGYVIGHTFSDYYFAAAFGACEYFAICLCGEFICDAFFTEGMTAFGDYSRGSIVEIKLAFA